MKVGDLVRLKVPTTRDFNRVFIIAGVMYDSGERVEWVRFFDSEGWKRAADLEVVNASR